MKDDEDCSDNATSRRGFVRRCLGTGAVLTASLPRHPQATSDENARRPLATPPPDLAEYERILSQTDRMDVLGRPRSWSVVQQGFHPFSPERIVVMPSGGDPPSRFEYGRHGYRCGPQMRARLDERIDGLIDEHIEFNRRHFPPYTPPGGWFPESKRESIFWIMDAMTDHYGVRPQFEAWVVALVGRELLGSTAMGGFGFAHQFQHGEGAVPVDCPPVDWWLFLYPEGLNWSSLDEKEIHAVFAHVARDHHYARASGAMIPTWALAQRVGAAVDGGWAGVARMGRIGAARHLNPIAARLMGGLFR